MVESKEICKRDLSNARLYEVVDLLLEINLDEKNGLAMPTQTDIKSNCCNRLVNIYNGLKIEYLKNHTLNEDDFKKRINILLHEDEEIFNEAVEIVSTLKTNYKKEKNKLEEQELE